MKAVIGIDPGAKGQICLLVPDTKEVMFISNSDKPIDIIKFLDKCKNEYQIQIVMIEDVHSIFGASAKSNFNFGFNTGLVTGIIQSTGLGLDKVQPKKWQKYVGVKSKGKEIKKEVGEICDRLYPNVTIRGPRGGLDDGKSDSLMIAHYAAYSYKL